MIRQKMIRLSDEKLFADFKGNPPDSPALIAQSQAKLSFQLPADYVQFLRQMNGGEGPLGENAYVVLSRVEQLGGMNAACEVAEFAPELFLFGSNGAGEAFAYDTRFSPHRIIAIPLITLDLCDAVMMAANFRSFLEVLFTSGYHF
jgi:hypothetical protein